MLEQNAQPQPVSLQKPKGVSRGTFIAALALVGVVGFIAGTRSDYLLAYLRGVRTTSETIDLSSVQDTFQALKANYDGTLDTAALIDGASRGLVAAAGDRYTVFMDSSETQEFNKGLSGEVSGIGVEIGIRTSQPTVVRVLADSPAEKAGLKTGDTIVSVNDESVQSLPTDEVATKIRGDAGTSVKLVVKRAEELKEFTITRAKVSSPSVRWEVKDGVGVIVATRFDNDTGRLVRQAASDLKSQNVKAVILDLRDNGGGYLDAARQMASVWLSNKIVVTEKRGETTTGTERTSGEAILQGVKTVVLVNGSSASASEIVAGALQEYGAATIMGEKTYGKGSVQQMIQLNDGRTLKVTIAKWYTPNGKNISKEGITPDKEVVMTAADTDAGRDPQLEAALAEVK